MLSQSAMDLSVNLEEQSQFLRRPSQSAESFIANESIITVNNDGFRGNIMREDLMLQGPGSQSQVDRRNLISFDSSEQQSRTQDLQTATETTKSKEDMSLDTKPSTVDNSQSAHSERQDRSPKVDTKQLDNIQVDVDLMAKEEEQMEAPE